MNEDDFLKEYYHIYKKARQLEKTNPDKALNLYLEILSKYEPRGTLYYERPCIILEKQKRYDEAIGICRKAIGLIEGDIFNADAETFKHRMERLIRKKDSPSREDASLNHSQETDALEPRNAIDFPSECVSVSFGKSSSSNFAKAITLAKHAPIYLEDNIEGYPVYQAVYSSHIPEQYLAFIQLYELVSNWKSSFVTMNGSLVDRKVISRLNYCYGDRCRAGSSRFCYGASSATKNPFGCHRLQVSEMNSPWWTFGEFIGKSIWVVDKPAIKKHMLEHSKPYSSCPAFSYDKIFEALEDLPNRIDLNSSDEWVVSMDGIQPRHSASNHTVTISIEGERSDSKQRNLSSQAQSTGCLIPIILCITSALALVGVWL